MTPNGSDRTDAWRPGRSSRVQQALLPNSEASLAAKMSRGLQASRPGPSLPLGAMSQSASAALTAAAHLSLAC
eukprot:4361168-Pyramimonas_sp.AAC.1